MKIFLDRKFRAARLFSNRELRRFGPLFRGSVANISAWKDEDKEGNFYREYFPNAKKYEITNFRADARGFQNLPGEIFLDLAGDLPAELRGRFDTVFNHTTLEHIFEARRAFANLCAMSRDAVIVVVPWLQEEHADYGDFWRFSPQVIEKLFAENNFETIYLNFNDEPGAAVYIFAIGVRDPEAWRKKIPFFRARGKKSWGDPFEGMAGCRAIQNSLFFRIFAMARAIVRRIFFR